jgi:hypothetical protein
MGNKLAKTMSSKPGWESSTLPGEAGNDQSLNNRGRINAFPDVFRTGSKGLTKIGGEWRIDLTEPL